MRSNRKQVIFAASGSVLLHLLLLALWALAVQSLPTPKRASETPPPIRLQLVRAAETPPPRLPDATPTPIPYLDTLSRAMSERPPDVPKFESAQNTKAASLLPATGDKPLPTQEGKALPTFAFDTTTYQPGAAFVPPPNAPFTEPPRPRPEVATPSPRVTPAPSHTPVPDDEFGLSTPTPTPEDTEPPFDPSVRAPGSTSPDRPTVASRSANQSNAAGFQADQRRTTVSGYIGKHGEANVDSVATPIGRYKNMVSHAISSKWYNYFYAHSDVISLGMLRVHIVIDRRGRVNTPRVVSNSSNEALVSVSIQAIMDAPIPPMPPETVTLLHDGELSMDLTFNPQ